MITAHKNIRILLSLLKQYDIRHFVISPGSRNMSIVKSVEDDPFFICYSVVDERSAAYFAIGLSLELRAPIVLTCTSGQATRNYLPGMTEAFYRKAPILAVTADYDENFTSQMTMQSLRQTSIPSDAANVSVDIPIVKDKNDEQMVIRRLNEALDALSRKGPGPAHVNLRIDQHWVQGRDELETARKITRHLALDAEWPAIGGRKVLLAIGQHHPFSDAETVTLDEFAQKHDVAIYVNHISNYNGRKSIHGNLRLMTASPGDLRPDLTISIGGLSGDYALDGFLKRNGVEHWRVCEDGAYGDTYCSLTRIFECPDQFFFQRSSKAAQGNAENRYYEKWVEELSAVSVPDSFPLSHALVAQKLTQLLPRDANLHLAILSSLRFWEFFPLAHSIRCYSNVAGFGIDGCLSTFLGQSVASKALNFLVIGDLSFFYDMNAIGIRHLRNNIRIVLINNNGGGEFRVKTHAADQFGDDSNRHIAASGHFGESAEGWVTNNKFRYIGVRRKEELAQALQELVSPSDRPVLMEVFTCMTDDAASLHAFTVANDQTPQSQKLIQAVKAIVPHDLKTGLKRLIGR